jgi:hypothetical protein
MVQEVAARTKMFYFELSMFLTEALTLAGALTLQFYGMTRAQDMVAYTGMQSYSILCAVTTFGCLTTTLVLMFVPPHWCLCHLTGYC